MSWPAPTSKNATAATAHDEEQPEPVGRAVQDPVESTTRMTRRERTAASDRSAPSAVMAAAAPAKSAEPVPMPRAKPRAAATFQLASADAQIVPARQDRPRRHRLKTAKPGRKRRPTSSMPAASGARPRPRQNRRRRRRSPPSAPARRSRPPTRNRQPASPPRSRRWPTRRRRCASRPLQLSWRPGADPPQPAAGRAAMPWPPRRSTRSPSRGSRARPSRFRRRRGLPRPRATISGCAP